MLGHKLVSVDRWNFKVGGWYPEQVYVLDEGRSLEDSFFLGMQSADTAKQLEQILGMKCEVVIERLDNQRLEERNMVIAFKLRKHLAFSGGWEQSLLTHMGFKSRHLIESGFAGPGFSEGYSPEGLVVTFGEAVESWLYKSGKMPQIAKENLFRRALADDLSVKCEEGNISLVKREGKGYLPAPEYEYLLEATKKWLEETQLSQDNKLYSLEIDKVLRLYYEG